MDILWCQLMVEVSKTGKHMTNQFAPELEATEPVYRSTMQRKLARQFLRLAVRLDPSLRPPAQAPISVPPSGI